MIKLTEDQKHFLNKYQLPESCVFDASGMRKKEYYTLMKKLDKFIAIGVTPCKAKNHTMRTRKGQCIQCSPEIITYFNRYYNNSIVYVAGSIKNRLMKIGISKDIKERDNALNNTGYAGVKDWKIIFFVNCLHAGKIESKILNKLNKYSHQADYYLGINKIACNEVFSCNYNNVKKSIDEIKHELPDEFKDENEIEDALIKYNFDNIETNNKKNTTISANSKNHYRISTDNQPVRRSGFSEDLNRIKNYTIAEIEDAKGYGKRKVNDYDKQSEKINTPPLEFKKINHSLSTNQDHNIKDKTLSISPDENENIENYSLQNKPNYQIKVKSKTNILKKIIFFFCVIVILFLTYWFIIR